MSTDKKIKENKLEIKKLRFRQAIDFNLVRLFFLVLFAAAVIAAVPSLRPKRSETEKRELAKFPKFSFSSFFSGDWFDNVSLWYSDTFPARDTLVKINGFINGSFGKSDIQIHGKVEKSDKVPKVKKEDKSASSESSSSSEPVSSEQVSSEPPVPPAQIVENLGAILLIDNSAYEYYNFNQSLADRYNAYINKAASDLSGIANVYDIIAPTAIGIVAPDDVIASVNSTNQKDAINYFYSVMNENVKKVDAYSALRAHRNEYLYFRTDHHWTALGAYYTYCELMKTKGVAPAPLSAFNERRFEGFLGTFYAQSGKNPRLAATPDTVVAYEPTQVNTIMTKTAQGAEVAKSIVSDGNNLGTSSKYLSFIGGDQPFGYIVNPQINDGSACIVVKESFGNAFVPFLTQNYQTVYVVDYRYIANVDARKLPQLAAETGAKDVIFLNNISATRNSMLIDAIGSFIG